jgi:hypothetical protein
MLKIGKGIWKSHMEVANQILKYLKNIYKIKIKYTLAP